MHNTKKTMLFELSPSEIQLLIGNELEHIDDLEEEQEEKRRASEPVAMGNHSIRSKKSVRNRSHSAPATLSFRKNFGFNSLESIREEKAITGKISVRQHGLLLVKVNSLGSKTKNKTTKSKLMHIELINECIRGCHNVQLLDFFKDNAPEPIPGDMDLFLNVQCNMVGVVCFNHAHIGLNNKYMKHRYNVMYDDKNKPNHNIMAFSAIYETVIGRANCAQFLTQTFYSMLDMILAKKLKANKKHLPRKEEKIWMTSIAQTYSKLDKLYNGWVPKQGISQSASNCTQCIVSTTHIYVCNLGGGGAFLWNGDSLKLITQRHITRCKDEKFRIISAGGKLEEKETMRTMQIQNNISMTMKMKNNRYHWNIPRSSRTSWSSDSSSVDHVTTKNTEKPSIFSKLQHPWRAVTNRLLSKQRISSYDTHTYASRDSAESRLSISEKISREINVSREESVKSPKLSKTQIVIPGDISTTRVFGLITTKRKCIEENKPKIWIMEPQIVKLKRSKDTQAILLVSSEILDTINVEKTQKLLQKSIDNGKMRTFCEKLCYKCELKRNPRSTIAALVCFPQKTIG